MGIGTLEESGPGATWRCSWSHQVVVARIDVDDHVSEDEHLLEEFVPDSGRDAMAGGDIDVAVDGDVGLCVQSVSDPSGADLTDGLYAIHR